MPTEDQFTMPGRDTVVTGCGEWGAIKRADEMELLGPKAVQKAVCTGAEMFKRKLECGEAGHDVGTSLRDVNREDVDWRQV
jgi:translation elongation factor EF-Tu-like GTPase